MGILIQQILFSDFMIFALLALVILMITGWANSMREYAGYALGWLVGIFFILALWVMLPPLPPQTDAVAPSVQTLRENLSFFQLIIPSFFGFLLGFGILFIVRLGGAGENRIGRALTIAGLMAFTLTSGFILLRTNIEDRWGLAVFALTFGIGALLNIILTRGNAGSNIMSRLGRYQ